MSFVFFYKLLYRPDSFFIINDKNTVEEVIKIGDYITVPKKVLYKTPNDGLSNQTDEDKLGFKYSEVASYTIDENSVPEEVAVKIKRCHKNNLHKFNIPTYRR